MFQSYAWNTFTNTRICSIKLDSHLEIIDDRQMEVIAHVEIESLGRNFWVSMKWKGDMGRGKKMANQILSQHKE